MFQQDLGQTWQLRGRKNAGLRWARVKSASRFSCFQVRRLNEARCIMIIYTTSQSKQVNRLQRIRATTESIPKFGLSPFPSNSHHQELYVLVTKAQPSFATITGKGNSPIPSIILLSRSFITQFRCHLPYAPPSFGLALHLCCCWSYRGTKVPFFHAAAETTTTSDHQSPFKQNK